MFLQKIWIWIYFYEWEYGCRILPSPENINQLPLREIQFQFRRHSNPMFLSSLQDERKHLRDESWAVKAKVVISLCTCRGKWIFTESAIRPIQSIRRTVFLCVVGCSLRWRQEPRELETSGQKAYSLNCKTKIKIFFFSFISIFF